MGTNRYSGIHKRQRRKCNTVGTALCDKLQDISQSSCEQRLVPHSMPRTYRCLQRSMPWEQVGYRFVVIK